MSTVYHGRTWAPPVRANSGVVSVAFDCRELDRWRITLGKMETGTKAAVSRAVNRALESFKTVSVRETAQKYFVKQKDIRASLTLRRSHSGSLQASMISTGRRKNLAHYAIQPKKPPVKPGTFKGAVKKRGGMKPIPKAFLMPHPPGFLVVIREKERGYKGFCNYSFLQSPSVPQLMKNFTTVITAEREAKEVFKKRLEHEVMRLMGLSP